MLLIIQVVELGALHRWKGKGKWRGMRAKGMGRGKQWGQMLEQGDLSCLVEGLCMAVVKKARSVKSGKWCFYVTLNTD